jgi:outer membrane lipoprotein SlyB
VLSVRPVTIDGSQSGVGTFTGAAIGGIAGSNIGGPRTGAIGGLVGLVAGGLIGNAVERNATKENGVEILLQLKNGERRSVVQANGKEGFAIGEPVVLVTTGNRATVTRAPDVNTSNAAPAAYPAYAPPPPTNQ